MSHYNSRISLHEAPTKKQLPQKLNVTKQQQAVRSLWPRAIHFEITALVDNGPVACFGEILSGSIPISKIKNQSRARRASRTKYFSL